MKGDILCGEKKKRKGEGICRKRGGKGGKRKNVRRNWKQRRKEGRCEEVKMEEGKKVW